MIEPNPSPIVDVVLPCLNEALALPEVLGGLPTGFRAIVVDNGSTDGSPDLARSLGALVIEEEQKGYGSACHRGLEEATADVVAFCDADASIDLAQLVAIAAPVLDGSADISLGWRRPTQRGAWPIHAQMANRFLVWRVWRTTGVKLVDIPPVRVARRQKLLELGITDRRSGYPLETIIRAARADWRFTQAPVDYLPRTGKSKVTGTIRGTAVAISDMSKVLRASTDAGPN